jgi:hypothetical protein
MQSHLIGDLFQLYKMQDTLKETKQAKVQVQTITLYTTKQAITEHLLSIL